MEIKYYGFIYITTNLVNNKKYIGMHKGSIEDNYLGSGKILTRAIEKCGRENFKREILSYANSKEELEKLEKYFIEKYNAVNDENFYNIHIGGSGGNTIAGYTEEEKQQYRLKMREALLNSKNPPYGHKLSDSTREKIRQKQLQHWKNISEEDRNKFKEIMRNAVTGEKNPNYNNHWNQEKKEKLSELRKKNGKSKGKLNAMYGKKDENAINGKKVYMYDENFNLIQVFNTKGLAMKFLNIKGHTQLNNAIKNKTMYKNYYWSNEEIYNSKV